MQYHSILDSYQELTGGNLDILRHCKVELLQQEEVLVEYNKF